MAKRRFNRRRKGKGKVPKATKKFVRNELHKAIEDKEDISTVPANAAQVANTTPSVVTVGNLAGGAGQSSRIGDKIRIKSIEFRGMAQGGAINLIQSVRIILVRDDANNGGTTVTMSNLFDDTAAVDAPNWGYNVDGKYRYKIMYDKTYVLKPTTSTNTSLMPFYMKKHYKKGIQVQYNTGTAATNADINKGAFYVLAMTNSNTTPVFIWYNFRITYEDA